MYRHPASPSTRIRLRIIGAAFLKPLYFILTQPQFSPIIGDIHTQVPFARTMPPKAWLAPCMQVNASIVSYIYQVIA